MRPPANSRPRRTLHPCPPGRGPRGRSPQIASSPLHSGMCPAHGGEPDPPAIALERTWAELFTAPRGGLARGNRRANDRGRGARPHRPQRLSHRAQGRVPAQAQQAAATRRRRRRQQSPGLKAGVHGRLRRLPGCKGGGARRHAVCESLPPRRAGRLHAQEASHTLGSGRPKASPPTSPRGGSHRQIRERRRAGARPRLSTSDMVKYRNLGPRERTP